MPRAKRSLSQNFLIDPNIQRGIVDALELVPADEVLEIGPGTGALTRRIAGHVRRLIAVELDDELARSLAAEFGGRDDVAIMHADFMRTDPAALSRTTEDLKVVGNIPYNITSPLIFQLLERGRRPAMIVIMIQREVADRILASPGEKAYGALSVGVRTVARVERLFHVGRGAFRPTPTVDSTVLRITPLRPEPLTAPEEDDLRALTRVTFGWRRKQLQRILRDAPRYGLTADALAAAHAHTGLHFDARPEDLAPDQFIALARALRLLGRPLPETP